MYTHTEKTFPPCSQAQLLAKYLSPLLQWTTSVLGACTGDVNVSLHSSFHLTLCSAVGFSISALSCLLHGLQGVSAQPWGTSFSSSSDFRSPLAVSHTFFLPHSACPVLPPLSQLCFPALPPAWQRCSAVLNHKELIWKWLCLTQSTEATPTACPQLQHCHGHPVQW